MTSCDGSQTPETLGAIGCGHASFNESSTCALDRSSRFEGSSWPARASGGIQTDLGCRVLRRDGGELPGLYAIGEAAGFGGGGMHGHGSLEGTFLGGCVLRG